MLVKIISLYKTLSHTDEYLLLNFAFFITMHLSNFKIQNYWKTW